MALARNNPVRFLPIAGIEVCWLYALFAVVQNKACGECLPLPYLFFFYPIAFAFGRLFPLRRNPLNRHTISWFAWLISAILFAGIVAGNGWGVLDISRVYPLAQRVFSLSQFPSPEFLTLAGSAILWGCGKRLSGLAWDESVVLSEFQFGVSILLVIFFVESQMGLQVEGLVPLTVIFFFLALTGLPAALLHSGTGTASRRRRAGWAGIVFIVVSLVLAAGLLAAWILKPELLEAAWAIVEAVGRWIGRLIARFMAFLASILPSPEPGKFDMPAPSASMERDPSFIAKVLKIPESFRKVAAMIVSTMWLVLFVAAIWSVSSSILKWMLRKMAHPNGAEIETLSGAFREDLVALMKSLVRKMAGLFGIRLHRRGGASETLSIRGAYRQFLRWSAKRGCGRGKAQTPREYLDALSRTLPGGAREFSLITSSYMEERYSPAVSPSGEIEKAYAALRSLKAKRRKELERRKGDAPKTDDEWEKTGLDSSLPTAGMTAFSNRHPGSH